jgi:hypothetical protein
MGAQLDAILVDAEKQANVPLGATADYIAMIVLTRMASLDTCSELPSIIDLLALSCSDRARPDSITVADRAFLKSLYAADLQQNRNIEQADIRDQMLTELESH